MSILKSLAIGCALVSMAALLAAAAVLAVMFATGWFLPTPIPKPKDRPTDFLHLSGTHPAGIAVQIVAQYATTNPRYKVSINWLEDAGAYRPRIVRIDTPVKDAAGSYDASIPLDKFQPGDARWAPDSLYVLLRPSACPPLSIDSTTDSADTLVSNGILICFNLLQPFFPSARPYTYGTDWASLSVPCRIYHDDQGDPQTITQASRQSVVYFPLDQAAREIRADFVPWIIRPGAP
jgi:hypothetical protein